MKPQQGKWGQSSFLTSLGSLAAHGNEMHHYSFLALQRNLQIIGAFSFLSRTRGKVFFARFILPALAALEERLQDQCLRGLRVLPLMVHDALKILQAQ